MASTDFVVQNNLVVSGDIHTTGTFYSGNVAIGNAAFDLRYTLSGADGSSANFVTVVLPVTLTVAESGKTIFTTASGTITLPAPIYGLNYRILANGNGAVTINLTAPAANIYFPDASFAATFTLPINWFDNISLYCDGTTWVMYDMNGRTIVANAVNANEAVALGQAKALFNANAGKSPLLALTLGIPARAVGDIVAVGTNPSGVAFDGTSIWVVNNGSASVSIIPVF